MSSTAMDLPLVGNIPMTSAGHESPQGDWRTYAE